MRTNFKKVLAVLLTLMMFCGLIPLSATSVSAATATLDLNWNDGTLGFSNGEVVSQGPDGSKCMKWTASGGWDATYITVKNMDPVNDYVITMKAKASVAGNMGITIQNGDWGSYWNGPTFKVTTSWQDVTVELPAGSIPFTKGAILFKFQDVGVAMDLYVDDLKITQKVVEVPAVDNLIVNGGFEESSGGWTYGSYGSRVSGGRDGGYALQMKDPATAYAGNATQNVAVEPSTNYTLTFWAKRVTGAGVFNIYLDAADGGTKPTVNKGNNWMNETSGDWVQYTLNLTTSATASKILIKFSNEAANTKGTLLVDDVVLSKDAVASNDGYIENGDFETGAVTPWTTYSSTTVNTSAKYEGNYGLYVGGDGGWGGLAYQQIKNLKKGQEYTATMWVKIVSGGANVQIKGSNLDGDSIVSQYRSASNSSSWTQITMKWTADATTGYINICGDGTGTAAVAYIDSIVIARVGGEIYPEELHTFGGASIKENSDGSGLAFKFDVAAAGVKAPANEFKANSGMITLGDTQYSLVRMGALMTNQASVGQSNSGFTMAAVNGTKVIDVNAKYVCALSADSVSFAVRVRDIPEKHYETDVYARPYYVYAEDGKEVIVYGEIQSDTYARVSNPKSSIKILSIGHSFSKDVMETYLWNMFKEGGYEEVVIGYLYMAGCSMPKHLYNIQNKLAQYEYGKNTNGTWVKKNNQTALSALQDEDWDYVNIQSSPDYIGGQEITGFKLGVNNDGAQVTLSEPMTEYDCIQPITEWIQANAKNSSVKTDYNMIWSFSKDCTLWSYAYHNNDQMQMYKNIVNITKQKVRDDDNINDVIPCATSIQNVRSSFMGDVFNMTDGYHLNDKGDYVAALTWYCHYSGDDASIMDGYTAEFTSEEFEAIAEAVNNAMKKPYEVIESSYK